MKHMLCGLSALATVCCATAAVAEMIETHKVFPPQDIKWSPASPALPRGAETSILYGNPDAEGMFALRIKMPRGFSIPPHTHLRPEVITVISGKLSLGLGEAADRASVESLPVGSLSIMPPRVVHYAFTDEDSIIQVNGSGPWAIDYVNPKDDLRLQIAPGLPASEGR
jgi:quercetin dioxygenase-like cupin family protein